MECKIIGRTNNLIVQTGSTSQTANLGSHGFFSQLLQLPPRRCIDLLRIAAGIHVVDRIVKRPHSEDEDLSRRLHIEIEVKEPDFWSKPDVHDLVLQILCFLTADDWSLAFRSPERAADLANQEFLAFERSFDPTRAALYSGGLDSAAGLADRLSVGEHRYILATVGHQSQLHGRVTRQLQGLGELFAASILARPQVQQSTLTTSLQGGKAKRMRLQERTQRSRALLFCAAGAVAADAYKLRTVEVFENGVGCVNLPPMAGMVGSSLSTRGAHPTLMGMMSRLLAKMIEEPFQFVLPFKDRTKGEMLRTLSGLEGISPWLQNSHSCVHSAIRVAGKTHCGVCPACIERRQAFAVAGIHEDAERYEVDIFSSHSGASIGDYFSLYKYDARRCLEGSETHARRLANHLQLTGIDYTSAPAIRGLLARHASEVLATFGQQP